MKLEHWLQDRTPPVPERFLPYLLSYGGDGEVTIAYLLNRGMEALEQALARSGRERESAFPLLAADAFVTYACEEAAAGEDFESECRSLMAALGERFAR
jgi:hypothetical protein